MPPTSDAELIRWLELVRRSLDAADARIEIGGQAPSLPTRIWSELAAGRRVVVLFDEPPADPDARQARLHVLVESFAGMTGGDPPAATSRAPSDARLSDALARLTVRADALQAMVLDVTSPVLWASSHERPAIAVDDETLERRGRLFEACLEAGIDPAVWLAGRTAGSAAADSALDGGAMERDLAEELSGILQRERSATASDWRRFVQATRAAASFRRVTAHANRLPVALATPGKAGSSPSWLARSFASIYALLLVFEQPPSQLRAEGAMVKALGTIQRLVLSLPPVDPPPPGGRVIRLRR
ncbi:MAG: hypothetical protein JRI23_08235 [Deltaproteobacteria bacterium]|jgi:hypothetical protein|nr:hypothetical protein [Deltaproteobacteria bacterium]MBW2531601.1 hypothetical protein [Deltaproteobacteria bacterium]